MPKFASLLIALTCAAAGFTVLRALTPPLDPDLNLLVLAIAAVSAFFSGTLLIQLRPLLTRANVWFLAFTFLFVFGALPSLHFDRRDQLLALLILPYLAAAALHSVGNPISYSWRALFALAAAAGIALQPRQALIPIAVEITVFVLRRRPRLLQIGLFLLAGLADIVARRLGTSPWRLFLPDSSTGIPAPAGPSLYQLLPLTLLALTAIVLYFVQRNWRRSPLTLLLLAAGAAAFLAALLPSTAANFRQFPAVALFALALAFELIDLAQFHLNPNPLPAPHSARVLTEDLPLRREVHTAMEK